MLTIHTKRSGSAVEITCDAKGVGVLLGALAKLMKEGSDHIHLRGPGGGGTDLEKESPWGEKSLSELIITYTESIDD